MGTLCARWGRLALPPAPTSTANFQIYRNSPTLKDKKKRCYARNNSPGIDNLELMLGDVVGLISFCTYKQISAIVTSPAFDGWLAPLHFNPLRFEEFASFAITIIGTWVSCGALCGGYSTKASADIRTALTVTSQVWLASMSVSAAQLVLLTAAEDGVLVGTEGFAQVLPLAASGPGEPFVSAAGVLGLMGMWRTLYASYFDMSKFLSVDGARRTSEEDAEHFREALIASTLLAVAGCVVLYALGPSLASSQLEIPLK